MGSFYYLFGKDSRLNPNTAYIKTVKHWFKPDEKVMDTIGQQPLDLIDDLESEGIPLMSEEAIKHAGSLGINADQWKAAVSHVKKQHRIADKNKKEKEQADLLSKASSYMKPENLIRREVQNKAFKSGIKDPKRIEKMVQAEIAKDREQAIQKHQNYESSKKQLQQEAIDKGEQRKLANEASSELLSGKDPNEVKKSIVSRIMDHVKEHKIAYSVGAAVALAGTIMIIAFAIARKKRKQMNQAAFCQFCDENDLERSFENYCYFSQMDNFSLPKALKDKDINSISDYWHYGPEGSNRIASNKWGKQMAKWFRKYPEGLKERKEIIAEELGRAVGGTNREKAAALYLD